jgi:hypothetical protein
MNRAFAFAAAAAALCCVHAPATADGQPAARDDYYYDGDKKLVVSPQPDLVAEFTRAGAASAVLTARPEAEELPAGAGAPRVFRVPAATFKPTTAQGSTTSPVFRSGTSPAGRLMALPGGMVVNFKPEWTDGQVREFCAARKLVVQRKLELLGNWYVLETAAGRASLLAANALHESGQVLSASPNWWKQTDTR